MERKAFPRGGATEEEDSENRNRKNLHWLPNQKKKKPSKKSRNDSDSDPDADHELEERLMQQTEKVVTIYDVSYKTIKPKMKLLGRVAEVHDNFVEVHLPGALIGTIPIYNVMEMLGSAGGGVGKQEGAPVLTDLFKVDQLIITEVISVVKDAKSKQGKGTAVYLTVDPRNIYKDLNHISVAQTGFVLQAFVRSVEDHGYILDCGIKNLHAFLNTTECEKYCKRWNNGNPLVKGQIVSGVVIKAKPANVQTQIEMSIEPGKVSRAQKSTPEDVEDVSQLLPGTRFHLRVNKKLSNGLSVMFDEYEGFLVERNIPHNLKDSDVGDSLLGCLLYVSKPLNVAMFSVIPSVVDTLEKPAREFQFGDIVKSALVVSEFYNCVGLVLNKKSGTRGRVPMRHYAGLGSDSKEKHKVGSTLTCRVLNFDSLSETYLCTTQESAIKESIFCAKDVPVGTIVTATVTGVTENHLTVRVGAVTGYIHWYHTTDAPYKNCTEQFSVGQKIKGRVLRHRGEKIDVTAKESLVKKSCVMLKSYEDAVQGASYTGTIVAFRDVGAIVAFFGDVKGVLPYSKTDSSFKKGGSNIGRLVQCSVFSCHQENLVLSLIPITGKVSPGFKCSPIISEIDKNNRTLQVLCGSSVRGAIPKYLLHDNERLADKIFDTYSIGDVVEDARCFMCLPFVVFSTRGSIRRFFDSDVGKALMDGGSSALKPGNIIPCFVKSLGSDVTLCTPLIDSNFVHRIPTNKIVAKDLEIGDYLPLVVKDAKSGLFDEYVADVLQVKEKSSVDFLSDVLLGNKILEEHAKKSASPLTNFTVGESVRGPIESTDCGFKVCMPNGVKGHVNSFCTDEIPTVGEIVQGIVIYVDFDRSELILSLKEDVRLLLNVNKKSSDVKDGVVVSGHIVRGFNEFYLAMVRINNTLRRAFIPKHVYPSRGAPLAVTKGMVGKDLSLLVVRKFGNDLLCVPHKILKKERKVKVVTEQEEDCGKIASDRNEKKRRKKRKRKNSSSTVDLEEAKMEDVEVVEQVVPKKKKKNKKKKRPAGGVDSEGEGCPKAVSPNEGDSKKMSPKKLKQVAGDCSQMNGKQPGSKDMKKQGIIQKLISKKKVQKKGSNANGNLPKKMENAKVFSSIIDNVAGKGSKSPLGNSSDSSKKSLSKVKLGKSKNIFKNTRKPLKRLKK